MNKFAIGALVAGALIGLPVVVTVTNVLSAPSRVLNKTIETNNIIFNYERFFDLNSNFDSRVSQVNQYKLLVSNETDKQEKINLRTELAGMQQSCRELANKYNADSQKLNVGLFKDRNLPYTLNATLCE